MLRAHVFPLVLVLAFGGVILGDDAPSSPQPDSAPSKQASPPSVLPEPAADQEAGGKDSHATRPVRQEHVIYLPFKNLRDVFENEKSSIVLPYSQFLEMWNRLVRPEQPPVKPPVGAVITRADYVGSVKGELVHLEATLDVEVLNAEWAQLPVVFGNAAIGSAKAKDEDVLLRGVGDGRYELLVQGKGKHQIKLALVIGVKSAAEGRSFTMQCPAVGVSNLNWNPGKDLAVQVAPQRTLSCGPIRTRRPAPRAVLGSTNQFMVSWQPKSGCTDQAAGLA